MKRGTPRHPKVARLAELLGLDIPTVVGHLEMLWHFTAEFAPQGDIGRYSDEQIAAACMFTKMPRKRKDRAAQCKSAANFFVSALIEARWLDIDQAYRLVVHDWHEHADDSVRKRLHRAGLCFVTDREKMSGQRPPLSGQCPQPCRTMSATMPDNVRLRQSQSQSQSQSL